jgi:hypothetical protein
LEDSPRWASGSFKKYICFVARHCGTPAVGRGLADFLSQRSVEPPQPCINFAVRTHQSTPQAVPLDASHLELFEQPEQIPSFSHLFPFFDP